MGTATYKPIIGFGEVLMNKIEERRKAGFRVTSVRLTLDELNLLHKEREGKSEEFKKWPYHPIWFCGVPVKEKTW